MSDDTRRLDYDIATVNMTMAVDKEKQNHTFDLPLCFNMSKQFFAPGAGFEC